MHTQEQQLILDLSQRLQQDGAIQKDKEADILIAEKIATQPDALYKLVQAVLLQQLALQQAQQDLDALRKRVQLLEQQNAAPKSTSFLGGFADKIFGTHSNANIAPPAPPAMPAGNPWQQPPQGNPYNQNPYGGGAPFQGASSGAGGGFLASAASSALGVAGGMALFHGMSNLFGGHGASSASPFGSGTTTTPTETTNITNNYYSDPNASQSNDSYGSDYDDFGGDDNF